VSFLLLSNFGTSLLAGRIKVYGPGR
jgi:hypothetical protein